MTDTLMDNNSNENEELLHKLLREYTLSDNEEILNDDIPDQELLCDYFKMVAISDTTLAENFHDDQCDDGRISLAYENLKYIPRKIAEKFSTKTKFLDLSYNNFSNLSFLGFFKNLNTLILDRNTNLDDKTFPYLQKLEILWMNNCNITNISKWIYTIQANCPNLQFLSIMGNPGAKTLYNGATINEHTNYRLFITNTLPNLKYLDDGPVPERTTTIHNELYTTTTCTSQSLRSLSVTYSPKTKIRNRKKVLSQNFKNSMNEQRFKKKRPSSCHLSSSTT